MKFNESRFTDVAVKAEFQMTCSAPLALGGVCQ